MQINRLKNQIYVNFAGVAWLRNNAIMESISIEYRQEVGANTGVTTSQSFMDLRKYFKPEQ